PVGSTSCVACYPTLRSPDLCACGVPTTVMASQTSSLTLGGVARVAMEYRQHLQMLNNISKLTANLAVDTKANKLGSPNSDTLSCDRKSNSIHSHICSISYNR